MAQDSIIGGLFGLTPEMYQRSQAEEDQKAAMQFAQLSPLQQASAGFYSAGMGLGRGIGTLLGAEDPQLRMIAQQQQILKNVDMNNPESIAQASITASNAGLVRLADTLAMRAREAGEKLALIQQRTEEKKTPEQRNTEALSNIQSRILQVESLPDETPGKDALLEKLKFQLNTLSASITKTQPTPKEIQLARESALLAGKEGSPEYTAAYSQAIKTAIGQERMPSMVDEYNFAKTAAGGGFRGTYIDFVNSRAIAGRSPAAPAPVTTTTVVDPLNPERTLNVDARTYRGGSLGSPGVIGVGVKETGAAPISAKDRQTREALYPKATLALKSFEAEADSVTNDLVTLANHPGLSGITGVLYGRTPSLTKDAREAQALYDKIIAKGGFQSLQNLRQSSPAGSGLGGISNQEGKQLQQSFAAIDRVQDKDSVAAALLNAAKEIESSKKRTREAYDLTYEYRGNQKKETGVVDFNNLKK